MLRSLVVMLLLANAGYLAWTKGWLASYGLAPASHSEPQRLTQQLRPEALRILSAQDAARQSDGVAATALSASQASGASSSAATECLQIGLFNEEQTVVLRDQLVAALPAGSWQLEAVLEPARWTVYMGKYSSPDALVKKRSELRGLGVSFEAVTSAALEPGLSLGSFKTQAEADTELGRIAKKGVKTAKVVQERAELRGQRLKLNTVDTALRSQLDSIKPQLAGKAFQTCK